MSFDLSFTRSFVILSDLCSTILSPDLSSVQYLFDFRKNLQQSYSPSCFVKHIFHIFPSNQKNCLLNVGKSRFEDISSLFSDLGLMHQFQICFSLSPQIIGLFNFKWKENFFIQFTASAGAFHQELELFRAIIENIYQDIFSNYDELSSWRKKNDQNLFTVTPPSGSNIPMDISCSWYSKISSIIESSLDFDSKILYDSNSLLWF